MGKMLILTFEDGEEELLNNIISVAHGKSGAYREIELKSDTLCELEIDTDRRVVVKRGREVELTYKEFEIFCLLAKNPGKIFSKEQIYDAVWGEPYYGDYNIVMSHIREKIEDNPAKPLYIQTVWGVGYRFHKNIMRRTEEHK